MPHLSNLNFGKEWPPTKHALRVSVLTVSEAVFLRIALAIYLLEYGTGKTRHGSYRILGWKIEFWVSDNLADASPRCLQDCIPIFSIQARCSNFPAGSFNSCCKWYTTNGLSLGSEFRHSQRLEKRIKFVAEAPF